MKKWIASVLLICLLSAPAFAVDFLDFQYRNEDGVLVVDVDAYQAAVAEEKVIAAGLDIDVDSFWYLDENDELRFDNDSFELAYAAALAELQEQQEQEIVSEDPGEDLSDSAAVEDPIDYPTGSYIDESGNVYSEDGDLLSSGSVSDTGSYSEELESVSDDEADSGAVENYSPAVYAVSDMRSVSTFSLEIVTGLKSLIISIFGEYTPVMTTMAVTETVDNVITTTLIDAVAEGAAGVDYEWLAGVFLFGILLYCMMKLLGGVLK